MSFASSRSAQGEDLISTPARVVKCFFRATRAGRVQPVGGLCLLEPRGRSMELAGSDQAIHSQGPTGRQTPCLELLLIPTISRDDCSPSRTFLCASRHRRVDDFLLRTLRTRHPDTVLPPLSLAQFLSLILPFVIRSFFARRPADLHLALLWPYFGAIQPLPFSKVPRACEAHQSRADSTRHPNLLA